MSVGYGSYGMPGIDAAQETREYDITWGGTRSQIEVLQMHAIQYSSTIRDAGSSPTTVIRAGLLVALNTSLSKFEEWDADASDGTQWLRGVLPAEVDMLELGTAADKWAPSPIVKAPLRAASLLIQGTALTSHADEFLARRALQAMGCTLDDDPQGYLAGAGGRFVTDATTGRTITVAENGTTFLFTGTGGVAVVLPAIQPGLEFFFMRAANSASDYSITSAGTEIIGGNSVGLASITWTTTAEMIGNYVTLRSVYVGTTLQWIMTVPPTPLGTGLTGAQAYAIA